MSKSEIVEKWYREGIVQTIVGKYACGSHNPKYDDLEQMIWLELLEKDDELIEHLERTGQYRYYIAHMVDIYVKSTEGPWHRRINRYWKFATELPTNANVRDKGQSEYLRMLRKMLDNLTDEEQTICNIVANSGVNCYGSVQNVMEIYGCGYVGAKTKIEGVFSKIRKEMEMENETYTGLL